MSQPAYTDLVDVLKKAVAEHGPRRGVVAALRRAEACVLKKRSMRAHGMLPGV